MIAALCLSMAVQAKQRPPDPPEPPDPPDFALPPIPPIPPLPPIPVIPPLPDLDLSGIEIELPHLLVRASSRHPEDEDQDEEVDDDGDVEVSDDHGVKVKIYKITIEFAIVSIGMKLVALGTLILHLWTFRIKQKGGYQIRSLVKREFAG